MSRGLGAIQRKIIEQAGFGFSVDFSYLAAMIRAPKPSIHRALVSLVRGGYLKPAPRWKESTPQYELSTKGLQEYSAMHAHDAAKLRSTTGTSPRLGKVQNTVLEYIRKAYQESGDAGVLLSAVYRHAGASRPSVARALKRLTELRLIERSGNIIYPLGR